MALNSTFIESYNLKILLAQRNDLTVEEIDKLMSYNDKDILINLARFQKLTSKQIDNIIPLSVYLVKIYLIKNQQISSEQQNKLINLMENSNLNYNDLIYSLKNGTVN